MSPRDALVCDFCKRPITPAVHSNYVYDRMGGTYAHLSCAPTEKTQEQERRT